MFRRPNSTVIIVNICRTCCVDPNLSVGHVVVRATLSTPRHTQVQRTWTPTQALERCSATKTDLKLPEPTVAPAKLRHLWRTRAGCDQHTATAKNNSPSRQDATCVSCQMHSWSPPNQQLSMINHTDVCILCVLLFHMPCMSVANGSW